MKLEVIPLPQDKDGKPDWGYMDMYMRSIEKKAKKAVESLIAIIE